MILDPSGALIRAITTACDIAGARVLEVGCGSGRLTRDLARLARSLVATDPDAVALAVAKQAVSLPHVTFAQCGGEELDFPAGSFDFVIYCLSLHHVPIPLMRSSLAQAGRVLDAGGRICVIEPADGGSLLEAKERFGAGSGDETKEKKAVLAAIASLSGWRSEEPHYFRTLVSFADEADFRTAMFRDGHSLPPERAAELRAFLAANRQGEEIVLDALRRLNVLSRT